MGGEPTPETRKALQDIADKQRIERDFTYHAPKADQPQRYVAIRDKAKELALLIHDTVPPSRERSLAFTNLEQATFWANAAIARNE